MLLASQIYTVQWDVAIGYSFTIFEINSRLYICHVNSSLPILLEGSLLNERKGNCVVPNGMWLISFKLRVNINLLTSYRM
jgi:hypothetical protein